MTTDITELAQSHELLIANGQQTADLLRHLADNEIDSDYFAVVSECESYGKETDAELSITEFALSAAGYVDTLVEALEKAQKRIAELDRKNSELDSLTQRWAVERAENAERIAELESRTVTINTPDARDEDYDWDGQTPSEAFNTCRRICALMFRQSLRTAGIKVEAE